MRRLTQFILIFLLLPSYIVAQQQHFSYKPLIDGIFAGYIVTGETMSHIKSKSLEPLTEMEVTNLSANDVNTFDRFATNNYSKSLDKFGNGLAWTTGAISILSVACATWQTNNSFRPFFFDGVMYATMYIEAMGITFSTDNVMKAYLPRNRPYAYNNDVPLEEKTTLETRKSFFSRHVALASTSTFYAATILSTLYPNTWQRYIWWSAAAILPTAIGYTRIAAGEHFITDVIAGYAYGAAIGTLVPYLHKKKNAKFSLHVAPQSCVARIEL